MEWCGHRTAVCGSGGVDGPRGNADRRHQGLGERRANGGGRAGRNCCDPPAASLPLPSHGSQRIAGWSAAGRCRGQIVPLANAAINATTVPISTMVNAHTGPIPKVEASISVPSILPITPA